MFHHEALGNESLYHERKDESEPCFWYAGTEMLRCLSLGSASVVYFEQVLNLIEGATRKMTDASLPNLRHQLSCERSLH